MLTPIMVANWIEVGVFERIFFENILTFLSIKEETKKMG